MRKTRKWLIITIAVAVSATMIGAIILAWATYGLSWSFQEWTLRELLTSLPEPPGWLPETDFVHTATGGTPGYRYYDVRGQFADVVGFFRTEFPETDWVLLSERETSNPTSHLEGTHPHDAVLLFSHHDQYCLVVYVVTSFDEQGVQHTDRVRVSMTLREESECDYW